MTSESNESAHARPTKTVIKDNGISGGIYGMGLIGAAVYFIQHAATFWDGVLGLIKAVFWPAVVMYKLLELLKP